MPRRGGPELFLRAAQGLRSLRPRLLPLLSYLGVGGMSVVGPK